MFHLTPCIFITIIIPVALNVFNIRALSESKILKLNVRELSKDLNMHAAALNCSGSRVAMAMQGASVSYDYNENCVRT